MTFAQGSLDTTQNIALHCKQNNVYRVPLLDLDLSKLTIHQTDGVGICNLTRVSAGICFSRIPNLAVRLIGPSLAWKDLKIQRNLKTIFAAQDFIFTRI